MNDFISNGLPTIIAQALEEMKAEQGPGFSLESLNLAELERRTGFSRSRLRRLKENGFQVTPRKRRKNIEKDTILGKYTPYVDSMLMQGITNRTVIFERLCRMGYVGSLTTVKDYVRKHENLIPAKRQAVDPQGNRGRRYQTSPGEVFQMDWGFVNVLNYDYSEDKVACFAMICHHCGFMYIEFFPNAKQENLFIGMIHAFTFMGIPQFVLTDNMKSVVIRRDLEGKPIWQNDYESFMRTVGFETKLCKPRHPYTKGKVERLIRFVKDNFLSGRSFHNITELNKAALEWCHTKSMVQRKGAEETPYILHTVRCASNLKMIEESYGLLLYLCPERTISFDGFIEYEGRRFGIPYSYKRKTVRVRRNDEDLLIYSDDLNVLLVSYEVTWARKDRYSENQFPELKEPEEQPTMPVKTTISQIATKAIPLGFEKFDFGEEDDSNE